MTAGEHRYDAAANWKTLTENYHECYHCPSIHPELCRVSPPQSGENYAAAGAWIGGWMDLRDGMETMSLDGSSGGVPLRGLDAQGLRTVIYVNIFPNVLLSLHPDYVMTHRLIPVTADRTIIECTWAFAPEAVARPDFDPATRWSSGTSPTPGLGRVRVGAARPFLAARLPRAAVARPRTRCTPTSRALPGATSVTRSGARYRRPREHTRDTGQDPVRRRTPRSDPPLRARPCSSSTWRPSAG